VVCAFGQEEKEITIFKKFLGRARSAGIESHIKAGFAFGFFMSIIFLCYAFSFYIGHVFIVKEYRDKKGERSYTSGDVIACFFGIIFGFFSLGMAAPNIKAVTEGQVAGKMAFEIIDRKPAVDSKPNAKKEYDKGEIRFEDCHFTYPSRKDQKILEGFCATLQAGKTTALVGPSGSGKSTIVQMIERFYDPDQGTVFLDGEDLKNYDLNAYRRSIGYVGQEPVLFNESVRENLKYGKPDATDEEIIAALVAARAWDFLQKQEGLDTNCGTGGSKFSGGQKQRIAIARAFIKKPKILVFDEATSALDKTNESEVQKSIDNIRKELGNVTMIVIAHRLSTIKEADQILVLRKGKIAEIGNHESLLKDYPKGLYSALVKTQEEADDNIGDINESDLLMDDHLTDIEEGPNANTSAYVINKEERTKKSTLKQVENDEGFDDLM